TRPVGVPRRQGDRLAGRQACGGTRVSRALAEDPPSRRRSQARESRGSSRGLAGRVRGDAAVRVRGMARAIGAGGGEALAEAVRTELRSLFRRVRLDGRIAGLAAARTRDASRAKRGKK